MYGPRPMNLRVGRGGEVHVSLDPEGQYIELRIDHGETTARVRLAWNETIELKGLLRDALCSQDYLLATPVGVPRLL